MNLKPLPELFGARGPFIQWERVLLFCAAMVIAKTAAFAVGYSVSASPDAQFSASWLRFGPPWELLIILAGQFAELVVVIAVFRFVRHEYAALVSAVLAYGLLYTPINLWLLTLALGPFQGSWMEVAVPRFATRVYYSLAFYGALLLGLRRGRSLLIALLVSAFLGTLLGDIAAVFVQTATNANAQWMTGLGLVAWGSPRTLIFAGSFAGALVVGSRLSRSLEATGAPRLSHSFFVGSYLSFAGAAVAIFGLTATLLDLGRWPARSGGFGPVRNLLSGASGPVLVLACIGWLLGIMGVAVCVLLMHRMWAAIEQWDVRMTPGKAVALLFVPVFNLYWICALMSRFGREFNSLLARHAIPAKRLSTGLLGCAPPVVVALSLAAAFVRFAAVAGLPCIAIVTVLISRVCDAVNRLPERSDTELFREERLGEPKESGFRGSPLAEEP